MPSLLACPNLDDLLVQHFDLMMLAAFVVVSICLLVRVFGFAPSLFPWRVSALGSSQSLWRTKGKGKKERLGLSEPPAICFSHASFILMLVLGFSGAAAFAAIVYFGAEIGAAATRVAAFGAAALGYLIVKATVCGFALEAHLIFVELFDTLAVASPLVQPRAATSS